MTIEYGLTEEGLVLKSLAVIRSDFQAAFRAAFGNIDVGDKSIEGQVIGIVSERLALIWELLEAINSSQDPRKATAAALDALCLLTGTVRPPATFSSVTLTLMGTPGTVVPSGSQFEAPGTGSLWATTASATIAAAAAWVATTAYVVGNRVLHDGNRLYQCITSGTSAGSGGPTGTGTDITDGTVHWKIIGDGVSGGWVDAAALCTVTGPSAAFAGDISQIATSVFGLDLVLNTEDAVIGRNVATDAELRDLRTRELSNGGNAALDAIVAHLVALNGVSSVNVFENVTDAIDADSMPPHSVECMVHTPTITAALDQTVVDTIFASVAAGIATTGNVTTGVHVDSQGFSRAIKFSRPQEIPIYVVMNVTVDATLYPADGDQQIKDAIATFGQLQVTGKDAVSSSVLAQAFKVDGVIDVTVCHIGTAPAPVTSVTVPITSRQLATFQTTNISVTSVGGTP